MKTPSPRGPVERVPSSEAIAMKRRMKEWKSRIKSLFRDEPAGNDRTVTLDETMVKQNVPGSSPQPDLPFCVGDRVLFGACPQTAEGTDCTPIEWRVIEAGEGKATLLSEKCLDCLPFDSGEIENHPCPEWEECSLRKWLNGTFRRMAFDIPEQRLIRETEEEGITLRSVKEAETVFDTSLKSNGWEETLADKMAAPVTDYARAAEEKAVRRKWGKISEKELR